MAGGPEGLTFARRLTAYAGWVYTRGMSETPHTTIRLDAETRGKLEFLTWKMAMSSKSATIRALIELAHRHWTEPTHGEKS